jgi:hypothetical protein
VTKPLPRHPAFLAALGVLLCGAGAMSAMIRVGKVHLQKLPIEALDENGRPLPFSGLPQDAPGFRAKGADQIMSAEIVEELGTQNYLSRWYIEDFGPAEALGAKPAGEERTPRQFELHLAYYTGTVDTVPHVPERCYVGGGMEMIGGSRVMRVPLDLELFPPDPDAPAEPDGRVVRKGRTFSHTYVRMPSGLEDLRMNVTPYRDQRGQTIHAGYFFIANGRVLPTAEDVRTFAFDLKERYSYYAKVQFMSPEVGSSEELAELAGKFLDQVLPEIARRTPDWAEVRARVEREGRAGRAGK